MPGMASLWQTTAGSMKGLGSSTSQSRCSAWWRTPSSFSQKPQRSHKACDMWSLISFLSLDLLLSYILTIATMLTYFYVYTVSHCCPNTQCSTISAVPIFAYLQWGHIKSVPTLSHTLGCQMHSGTDLDLDVNKYRSTSGSSFNKYC